jgi:hypothetical protein
VRDHLIPAAAREHLPKEPLWSSVTSRRPTTALRSAIASVRMAASNQ